jgi:hypothetical protein
MKFAALFAALLEVAKRNHAALVNSSDASRVYGHNERTCADCRIIRNAEAR